MVDRSPQRKALLLLFLCLFTLYLVRYHLFPALSFLTADGETRSVPPPVALEHGEGKLVMGIPIDINSAAAEELAALPGIGPALAGRIVAMRSASGPFSSIDELRRVKGVGPKKVDAVRGLVVCRVAAVRY